MPRMKAMALTGLRRMETLRIADPAPPAGREALLRVEAVGVCGSDVHYYATGRIGSQVVEPPFIVGHECAATVLEAGPGTSRVRPGERVGILGAGPIGLCVLSAAREAGASRIYVTEPLAERRDAARRAGADWTGAPAEHAAAEIGRLEPLQLDAVFECSGDLPAFDDGVRLLKPGGRLLLVGIPEAPRVSFEIDLLRRKEIRIQNVRRQNGFLEAALQRIEDGRMNVDLLVTHRFGFADTAAAFELVDGKRDGVIKAMIRM